MKTINYLSRRERFRIYCRMYRRYLWGLLILVCICFVASIFNGIYTYREYVNCLMSLEAIKNNQERKDYKKSVEGYGNTLHELTNNLSYKQYSDRMMIIYKLADEVLNIRHKSDAALGIESIIFRDDSVVIKGFSGESKTADIISKNLPKEEGKYHATQHVVEGTTGFSFTIRRDSEPHTTKKKIGVSS